MPSSTPVDPVPWPPRTLPVDLKSAAIAFAETRAPDITPTAGRYRRIVQQLESRQACVLETQPARPLGFLDGVQCRVLMGRVAHRDLTLVWVGAGTVRGHTLLDHQPRLAVVCSHLDLHEVDTRAPQLPVVCVEESSPWGVALACDEWIDQARRNVETLAVASSPPQPGSVLVVDGSLPRDSARNDIVGVCKKVLDTDWLPNPDLLPLEAGWRSPILRLPAARARERDVLTAYVRLHTATAQHPYGHALVRVEVFEDSSVSLDSAAAMIHDLRGKRSSGDPRWSVQLAPMFEAEKVLKAQIPHVMRTLA